MCTFLLLSLLSGILEIGVILSAYASGRPVWEILAMGAMYQLGNLLYFPRKLKPSRLYSLGIFNLCLGVANLYRNTPVVTAIQIALSSLCIQAVRAGKKSVCPTWLKRAFRIGGFFLAPLMIVYPWETLFLCGAIPLAAALKNRDTGSVPSEATFGKKLSATMIFHQMHYFAYTYMMPLAVLELTGNPYICVALYAFTWVIYLLPGLVVEERKGYNSRTVFFLCHSFLAIIMGILTAAFMTGNIKVGFCAWMLTGLGGGSVFCIRHLTKRDETCNMTLSENIGHFAGTLVSVAVSLAAGQGMNAVSTAFSLLFVCMTLASAIVGIGREERRGADNGIAEQGQTS